MNKPRGMLTPEALRAMVAAGEIETVIAGFTDHYGRLMGKRFDAEMFVDEIAKSGGHACNYLLTVDMEMEPVAGYEFANWSKGYGDFALRPDLTTLRVASWLDKTALVICDVVIESGDRPVPIAPRSLLIHQIERARSLGFTAKAGSE